MVALGPGAALLRSAEGVPSPPGLPDDRVSATTTIAPISRTATTQPAMSSPTIGRRWGGTGAETGGPEYGYGAPLAWPGHGAPLAGTGAPPAGPGHGGALAGGGWVIWPRYVPHCVQYPLWSTAMPPQTGHGCIPDLHRRRCGRPATVADHVQCSYRPKRRTSDYGRRTIPCSPAHRYSSSTASSWPS